MYISYTAFLAAAHGIAVINIGAFIAVHARFQGIRISKFTAAVGQNGLNRTLKVMEPNRISRRSTAMNFGKLSDFERAYEMLV